MAPSTAAELSKASERFAERVRRRRIRAENDGEAGEVARLRAMESALRTKLVPALSPEAVLVAGRAARAAHTGVGEQEFREAVVGARTRAGGGVNELYRAIRLLKLVDLWPWDR